MVPNNGVYASGEKSLYQLVQFISKAPSSVQQNTSPASVMILDVLFVSAVCYIVSWS
jgi:hypothetical protein